jgi:uncharacterized integral membrane protein
MSETDPAGPGPGTPGAAQGRPGDPPTEGESPVGGETPRTRTRDPLRGSRTSGIWVAVVALVVLLTLLAVFVLQNTQQVSVSFLGWTGEAPLAATLLIATASGLLIAVAAGSLRILQLRRRVRRERKG